MGVVRISFLNSSIKPKVSTAPSSPLKKEKRKKMKVVLILILESRNSSSASRYFPVMSESMVFFMLY